MKKSTVITAVVVVALAAVASVFLLRETSPQAATLRIAVNLPLSGPIAAFMEPYPLGLRMGLDDGATALGLPPESFVTDTQDNAGKPTQAVSVMQKQKLAGFDVYISGSTEMTMALINDIDATKRPHFLIAFDAYMTGRGPDRLRVLPNYKLEGPLWVEYARKRGAKKVFALTLNNAPIEEEFTSIVEPGLRSLGVEFTREKFEWTGSDYRALALKARDYAPDLIMVNGYSVHLYPAISALRALGLVKDRNTIAALDYVDLLYSDTPRSELTDVAFMCPLFEVPGAVPDSEGWRQRFEQRFGKRPSYVAAYAYDTGRLLAAASTSGRPPSKADILAVLPIRGVSGEVVLDKDGDLASTLVVASLASSGTVEQIR
jgi:ABC-type branched-subunit amino acid transport system substrate-binding protein